MRTHKQRVVALLMALTILLGCGASASAFADEPQQPVIEASAEQETTAVQEEPETDAAQSPGELSLIHI